MTDYSNHVPGFTKLFSGIVHSTVWREPMHIKVVWITMLALADRNGHVLVSMPGLADAARVTLPQCEEALKRLTSPDTHSRTKTNQGRRIKEIDGGWGLLNYLKYRTMRDEENRRGQVRDAVRRYRKRSLSDVINVSHVSQGKPNAEAEAEAEAEERNNDLVELRSTDDLSKASHEVFRYWQERTNHPKALWTKERGRILQARLREESLDVSEAISGLRLAVDGAVSDPFFNGSENGRSYLDFENIFVHKGRNRIEKLQRLARSPERTRGNSRAERIDAKAAEAMRAALEPQQKRLKP